MAKTRALVWIALAGSLSCGGGETPTPASSPSAPPAESQPTESSAPPADAADPEATAPGSTALSTEAGAAHYALYCANCHGATGDGDGPLAASLDPKPTRHSDAKLMNALSDEYLFRVTKEGGAATGKSPLMAPWGGTLSDAQIRDVVAYVRTLAKPPVAP